MVKNKPKIFCHNISPFTFHISHFTSHISHLTSHHLPLAIHHLALISREGQKRARSKADGLTRQGHAQIIMNNDMEIVQPVCDRLYTKLQTGSAPAIEKGVFDVRKFVVVAFGDDGNDVEADLPLMADPAGIYGGGIHHELLFAS